MSYGSVSRITSKRCRGLKCGNVVCRNCIGCAASVAVKCTKNNSSIIPMTTYSRTKTLRPFIVLPDVVIPL